MAYKVIEQLLTPNKYSRPQMKHRGIKGIVIHWVANPNTSAKANRDFFESRKGGTKSYGSAHEIIDLDGEVIVCIPKDELAYHVGSDLPYKSGSTQVYTPAAWEHLNTNLPRVVKPYPNNCTYGIEATHIDMSGKMTAETYNTLVERCADLCVEFKIDPLTQLYIHQEVVGWKDCHRWFVNNPNEWKAFKQKVYDTIHKTTEQPVVADDIKIVANNVLVANGRVIEGSVFVGLRKIAEALQTSFLWDNDNKLAYISETKLSTYKIIDGSVYIGIREVGEILKYSTIKYDNTTKKVYLYK